MPIQKVIVYITAEDRLLVFRQPDSPEQGLQVPGGTVEPGESLEQAALREASEETGLNDLRLEALLGSATYVTTDPPGVVHRRHFFHLSRGRAEPADWIHVESKPTAAAAPRLALYWVPLVSARVDWEMDAYLDLLLPRRREG